MVFSGVANSMLIDLYQLEGLQSDLIIKHFPYDFIYNLSFPEGVPQRRVRISNEEKKETFREG